MNTENVEQTVYGSVFIFSSDKSGDWSQVKVYNERKYLAHSLNDAKTAVEELNKISSAIILVVIIIVWLLLMLLVLFSNMCHHLMFRSDNVVELKCVTKRLMELGGRVGSMFRIECVGDYGCDEF